MVSRRRMFSTGFSHSYRSLFCKGEDDSEEEEENSMRMCHLSQGASLQDFHSLGIPLN